MNATGHTASASDVVVGSKWRNRKSGIVAEVVAIARDCVRLKRDKRPETLKYIDLLLFDYELVTDEDVSNTRRIPASRKSGCSTQELCSDAEVAVRSGRPPSGTVEHDGVESAVGSTPDEEMNRA